MPCGIDHHDGSTPRSRGGTTRSTAGVASSPTGSRNPATCVSTVGEAATSTTRSPRASSDETVVIPRSRSRTVPSASRTARRSSPSTVHVERDPSAVEEGEAPLAEHPLREPDVALQVEDELDPGVGAPAIEAPEAGPVAAEPERAVAHPRRLADRLALPVTGHHRAATAVVDHEPDGVPRHVGLVPLEPAEGAAVGAPARVAHEVGPLDHHLGHGGHGRVEPHDGVDDRPVGPVVLPHGEEARPIGRHVPVGVPEAARHLGLRGQRDGLAVGTRAVHPLCGPVDEPEHAVAHPPRAAAVLVYAGSGVPRARRAPRRRRRRDPCGGRRTGRPPRGASPTTTRRRRRAAPRWAGARTARPARS